MKDADFFEPSEILFGQIQCYESQLFSLVVMFNLTSFWVRDNSISISEHRNLVTGLHGKPSHKMGFRSSVSQSGHPGEGKHEGLVRRNDVLTNGFIGFSLAWTLARILFVPCLPSPWKTHKALRTWRSLFALFEAIQPWESLYNFFIVRV